MKIQLDLLQTFAVNQNKHLAPPESKCDHENFAEVKEYINE